ncbi:MAG: NAD(P)H-hydrate dehydratase [Fimbriimonadaceae bacterium]|nr:MAG: NAD(P)H-hydrate dehydratase [Fimbriimonadaceae bacterium]
MWIANQRQCQGIDRRATAEFGISSEELMERAGEAVYAEVLRLNPEKPWLGIVCGRGNNGGDGLVVARHSSHAYKVLCIIASPEFELNENCSHQLKLAREAGIEPLFSDNANFREALSNLANQSIIVDALLGTGAHGSVLGPQRNAITAINESSAIVVAVDVPSGIETNTGRSLGAHVIANKTISFGLPKPCFFQGDGLEASGDWVIADIGFPRMLLDQTTEAEMTGSYISALFPSRTKSSHKGSNGHLLIVAGSNLMPGAAVLATKAALHSGIGLVTIASTEKVCQAVSHHCPEALLLPLPENEGVLAPLASRVLGEMQTKFSAAVFGPGLTQGEPIQELLAQLWDSWYIPAVIDADALNVVSQGVSLPHSSCVLTPHPGEMARLLEMQTSEVQANRFKTIEKAVGKFNQTVLLKGAYTMIAYTNEPIAVNPTGNPGMATGGMGDVLSGVIGTLLAQNLEPYDAAMLGAYWHGFAGDLCAQEIGKVGFTASDVASYLPQARAKIISS